ncbi:MAG: HD domain-containing phosphohydrolase [bacterium]
MQEKEQVLKKLSQDITIRFVVAGVGCVLLVFFWFVGELRNLWPVVIVMSTISLLNTILYSLIKKEKANIVTEYSISIVDFSLITYGVSITGGIKSPFFLLYVLMIFIEGLYANKVHIKYNLFLSCISYTGIVLIPNYGELTQGMAVSMISRLLFLFLAGGVSLYYARILLAQKLKLESANKERTRLYKQVKDFNEELETRIKVVTEDLNDNIDDLQHLFVSTVKALSSAIVAKDPYTRGHNERMLAYTLAMLEELRDAGNFDFNYEKFRGTLQLAVLLHDIGKIGIADEILQKPGALTPEEWEDIKTHPSKGVAILEPIKELKEVANVIKHHHECYDGNGYPEGLKADKIPLISRIIAIADTFDAMTSDRPYRGKAKDIDAIEEIKRCSGSQFDPAIVNAFLEAAKKGKINSPLSAG